MGGFADWLRAEDHLSILKEGDYLAEEPTTMVHVSNRDNFD